MKQVTNSIDLNDIEYQIKQIDETEGLFNTTQISNNEQYLAYGGTEEILKIYDIKYDKLVRQLVFNSSIITCQFSSDSSLLFVGLSNGYVYGYDVLKEFKQIFRKEIHKYTISQMIIIKRQYLITCSNDKTIIKTDIRSKKQIFKLIGHTDIIQTIDYNQIDDIIISASGDQSIKLWGCKNRSIVINKQHLTEILQLQLIDNNQNVLSLEYNVVLKWKIDLIKRDLIIIKEFSDHNRICSFYQVNNGQNLLLICKQYFQILNDQGKIVHQQNHDEGYYLNFQSGQLDNLRYIHIQSSCNIFPYNSQNQVGHCKDKMKYHKQQIINQYNYQFSQIYECVYLQSSIFLKHSQDILIIVNKTHNQDQITLKIADNEISQATIGYDCILKKELLKIYLELQVNYTNLYIFNKFTNESELLYLQELIREHYIEMISNITYHHLLISHNRYMYFIQIHILQSYILQNLIKEIKSDHNILMCQFTNDYSMFYLFSNESETIIQ